MAWNAIINADGTIHNVSPDLYVLNPGQTLHPCTKNVQRIENYVWNGSDIELRPQAEVDAAEQQRLDEVEAERLMKIAKDDLAAKEAKKTVGLTQGVIDELTKKEK